jgi:hypothetical protein
MWPYITSLRRSWGIWEWGIKNIVLVPFSRLPIPCASLPNLLANECAHSSLCLGLLMRWWYSIVAPVPGSMMEHAQCSVSVVIRGWKARSTLASWLLLSMVVMRLAVWSRGMRCRLGYRGSCLIRVGDTLGDLRRGSGVVTLGGDGVGSLLTCGVVSGGPVGLVGPLSSGSMMCGGMTGLPYRLVRFLRWWPMLG